jgi:hypothetical protein
MDDLERWLRTQMQAATLDSAPDLLTGVWQRRRTHLRRTAAAAAAALAAVAIAVPSVLASTTGHRTGPATGTPVAVAAPGSELLKCGADGKRGISGGELSGNWRAASLQLGPVWFVYASNGGWRSSQRLPSGKLRAVEGVVVAIKNGTTAEISTGQPNRFRFLTAETASGRYTLGDGVASLTLVACPRDQITSGIPPAYAAGLTLFYLPLGYVTTLTGCLPVQIRTPPSWRVSWTASVPLDRGVC